MKTINVARGVSFPAEEFIENKFAIIGQSGRGKSGLLKVIEESLYENKKPFVVLDPAGIAWGIRSSIDGKGPGMDVLIIGGEHQDLPLDPRGGSLVAKAIVEKNVSAVIIDFSSESKATYRNFVKDFADTLYAINDVSRLVIIDEAPELLPQRIRPDQTAVYDSVERLVRQGRNRGIGVILVSQRAATLNKDVMTQCATLFVFGLVGKPDRIQLKDWVEAWATNEQMAEFKKGLASLEPRECWVWSPAEFKMFLRAKIKEFTTLHPDRTHLRRLGLLKAKPVTTDVKGLVAQLGEEFHKLAQEKIDVAEVPKLRARLKRAEDQLVAKTMLTTNTDPRKFAQTVDAAVGKATADLKKEQSELEAALRRSDKAREKDRTEFSAWQGKQQKLLKQLNDLEPPFTTHGFTATLSSIPKGPVHRPSEKVPEVYPFIGYKAPAAPTEIKTESISSLKPDGTETPAVTGGPARLLKALYSHDQRELTRSQLAILVGIKVRGSTFSNYLSILKVNGLVETHPDGLVVLTEMGASAARQFGAEEAPRSHEEIMGLWRGRLGGTVYRMLEHVVQEYPNPITRQELAERMAINPTGSTASNYLSLLRTSRLVEVNGQDVKAASALWP